ncbi:glycosyltransferase family 2 protein [Aquicella lusitana]|uniref:Glycosyltransferase involved in cell wall biosynthesis n=1 Tax=Aquicella lusitana TaxID=254246 RepID=A0A370GX65_9COXI|nr:glycosyltransferase family 2 protein [Aquicella lusitana]RDI48141.1 glycosyltransferase involved in cell wall biosynthesis [Aquicella lusitana]VVC72843.1 Poly-beta-1,6-N-acetyl-D-glucosamine synthase [Aquicella lusitana]
MTDISFIVTCYNEEKHVIGAIETVHKVATFLGLTHEILVFDDASKDGTSAVVKAYMQQFPHVPVQLYQNKTNKGVAYNFVEGAFQGKGKYCRLICGDNIESIETHTTILKAIGQADMVIPFYRVIEGRTLLRHLISKGFTRVVNLISGFSIKYYNGCPVFKRTDIMRWHVEATGLGYQAELIIRLLRQGKSYIEVAVDGFDREGSVSFRLRNVLSVCHSIVKISLSRLRVAVLK